MGEKEGLEELHARLMAFSAAMMTALGPSRSFECSEVAQKITDTLNESEIVVGQTMLIFSVMLSGLIGEMLKQADGIEKGDEPGFNPDDFGKTAMF